MNRCSTCILPDTYPGIQYSADGQCNQCRSFRPQESLGSEALNVLVSRFRNGTGKYDCIVPVSGGRDSSYVLAYVVDELRLRPLALTVDNGFMPDEIRQSIASAVRILGVDHIYVPQHLTREAFSATLKAWQLHPDPAMIAFLCNGCQGSIKKAVISSARAERVPLIIGGGGDLVGGGGEPEGSFAEVLVKLGSGFRDSRIALAWGVAGRLFSNRAYLQSPTVLFSYAREAYYRFLMKYPKDLSVVGLFEYLDWNEDQIVSTIVQRLAWMKPACWNTTWRADCKIHWLKEFLYRETLGFTKNDEVLSGMVRAGMITRSEALERLPEVNELPEEEIADLLAEFGLNIDRLHAACLVWRDSQVGR